MQEIVVRLVGRCIGEQKRGKQLGNRINMKEKVDGEWSPFLNDEIVGIVEIQIARNNPKETKETLERLIKLGYDRDEAIEKISSVVVGEIYNILKFHERFNERRFVERLHSLK